MPFLFPFLLFLSCPVDFFAVRLAAQGSLKRTVGEDNFYRVADSAEAIEGCEVGVES